MNFDEHNPMEHWPGENISDSQTYDTNGRLTIVAIITLSTVGIVLAFSFLYDRCSRTRNHHPTMFFFATTNPSTASVTPSSGLDPAVVKSLPVFTFSAAKPPHKDHPIDCAVCLSEFEEGESGRVLPGCKHAFHVECIDMWFHSHSTCPLCRSLVTVGERDTIITIYPEPVSSSGPGSSAIETPRRSISEVQDDLRRDIVMMTESDIERGEKRLSDLRHVDVP